MVESVDKRDGRDERPGGGVEVTPARDATTTRAGEHFGDMSDKQTASSGAEGTPEPVREATPPAQDEAKSSEANAGAERGVEDVAAVLVPESEPASGARVIPFVPRNGVVRTAPLPQIAELRFSRPTAGPAAYGVGADTGSSLPPAQPPPPSGFRRSAALLPSTVEVAPATLSTPAGHLDFSGGNGGGFGSAVRAAAEKLRRSWSWRTALKFTVLGIIGTLLAYALLVVVLAVAYRWVNPPTSTLMLSQRLSGTEISQVWTPIDRISPILMQAVILSEDGQFCRHRGVDWLAMKEAIEQSLDGNARGGSTISMQTVKNLFLWSSKSYVRKAIELPLAMGTELVWPKQRMLELYLNIAEWGPGIFGAEAASRQYFGKSAAYLTMREAALLAVALPNPIERQTGAPSAGHQRLADRLQARMRRVPNAAACAIGGRGNRAVPGDGAGQRRKLPL